MVLGIIPAREGSKGIIGKNMIDLGGRPLLDYSLQVASECGSLDRVILSTDMMAAMELASNWPRIEVPFVRPAYLSTDRASTSDVVLHAVEYLEDVASVKVTTIVLLEPTCPFRRSDEIDDAIEAFLVNGWDSLVGVTEVWQHPADCIVAAGHQETGLQFALGGPRATTRQEFGAYYFVTGALYVCSPGFLRRTNRFFDERSAIHVFGPETMIDIDDDFHLLVARSLVPHLKGR